MENDYEETEDLSVLINELNEKTESLDNTVEMVRKRSERVYQEEMPKNDFNEDFSGIIRKKDYKGKEDDIMENTKSKRKLKKWVYLVFAFIVLLIGLIVFLVLHNKKVEEEKQNLIADIKSHYSEYVRVIKDTPIYDKNNKKIGTVYKNAVLKLEEEKVIDEETKYFHVKDSIVNDYYVPYKVVSKSSKQETDDRYKNYIPFEKAVVASDFTLYLNDEKLISFDDEAELPIIINDYEGKYYVEYNDMLVGIKKDEVKELQDYKIGEGKKNQSKITTLAYHRVYDTGDKCTDAYVCIKKENFDKEMKYLSDNKYLTLTLNELYMYLNGNIQVNNAVVITFDDGYLYKAADEVLRKYNLNGTMFVITGDFADFTPFKEVTNLDIQSHTNNMHRNYVCSGGSQGGAILCAGEEKIKEDLLSSINKLGTEPIGMAFPFYDYNDTAIKAVKAAGFKMAFVGRAGQMGKATPKVTDMYKIPRMTVYDFSLMSFDKWKSYL